MPALAVGATIRAVIRLPRPRHSPPSAFEVRAALLMLLGAVAPALAAPPADPALQPLAEQLAEIARAAMPAGARLRAEVELGRLDPRLKLAPCPRIEPSVPAGARLWGRTRVALQCVGGTVAWRAWLPVTVRIFGPGPVAATALAAGTELQRADLAVAEVEYTAQPSAPPAPAALAGRQLLRPLAAGEPLRDADLRARVWFQGGDTVRVLAVGDGWAVSTEGVAESAGLDGRSVRVRTGNGRSVEGRAVGPRRVELRL